MDLFTAFTLVNERNGKLNVNHGFLKQLMELERKLFNKNTMDFFNKASRRNGGFAVCAVNEEEEKPKASTPRRRRLKKSSKSAENEEDAPKPQVNHGMRCTSF